MNFQKRVIGDSVLVFVTLCWGITFPLIENAMKEVDAFVFVTARFFLATLLLFPFVYKSFKEKFDKKLLVSGLILGLFNVVAYNAQSIGLETISAGQSAFITGASVVMVPFLLPIFRMGSPSRLDIISALFCLIGLGLLTGANLNSLNEGCLWTLICAFAVALSIIYLQKVSEKQEALTLLAFYQILFTGLFSSLFSFQKNYTHLWEKDALMALVFCTIFATSIALLLQTKYQRYTTPSRAAMIFCLEPLFASLFSYILNGETFNLTAFFGGIFIIGSLLMPEIYRIKKR